MSQKIKYKELRLARLKTLILLLTWFLFQFCPDYSGQPVGLESSFTAFGILLFGLAAR